MANYITPKMKSFIESSINNDFGLTVDQVADKCKSYGRFRAWLNSDITRIKEVLNVVKNNGVSPAFFASYEKTEGYNSKWGWLNHTSIKGTPVQDAISVTNWIKSQSSNTTSNPAWIDYANYKDFVPKSVKTYGNAHFKRLPSGTIGKVVIAGTAAATWEVYYPNGLKKSYNGVQNYGSPINSMIDTIVSWGGNLQGGGGGVSFQGDIISYYLETAPNLSVTSEYGWRTHPITGLPNFHEGADIAKSGSPSPQTPVPAQAEIIKAGASGTGLGNWVVYNLIGSNYMIVIGHFASVSVRAGDIVEAGTSVGVMGASGNVTGRHWHIEVRTLNKSNIFGSPTHDPRTTIFNIEGGGDIIPTDPIIGDSTGNLIQLFLVGALNNWK